MRRNLLYVLSILFMAGSLSLPACKKDKKTNAGTEREIARNKWLPGKWVTEDIEIAASISSAQVPELDQLGISIESGTSIIFNPTIAAALGLLADVDLACAVDNTYEFGADGTYSIEGCDNFKQFMLPGVGEKGKWKLTIFGSVLQFTNSEGVEIPHWINTMKEDQIKFGLTIDVGLDVPLPLTLVLKKTGVNERPKTPREIERADWLTGNWHTDDVQIGVTVSEDLVPDFPIEIHKGTSMLTDPVLRLALQLLAGINLTCVANNQYQFNSDGTYSIQACPVFYNFLFNEVKETGNWNIGLNGDVLELTNQSGGISRQWINSMSADSIEFGLTIEAGLDMPIPTSLILKR